MGTRHIVAVFLGGEYKVAQYGHFGGSPGSAGLETLNFLRKMQMSGQMDLFREMVSGLQVLSNDEWRQIMVNAGWEENQVDDNERIRDLQRQYPLIHRAGTDVLDAIMDEIGIGNRSIGVVRNEIDFVANSLFCEWAYVIDLDKGVFEVFKGWNRRPLGLKQRFRHMAPYVAYDKTAYHPVRLVKAYSLDRLPSAEQFLSDFKEADR
jgi:hypothetical protein